MDIELKGISIGPLDIRFYSVMILSGLLVGIVLAQRLARRLGQNPEHVVNITVIGAVLGLVGARLYHVFDQNEWPFYRDNPDQIFAIWNGGIGIFGAVAGALLGLFLYVRWKRLNLPTWLDIGAPAFLLGQAIGRWGNFFNQELFGRPTDLAWGIPISAGNVASEAPQFIGEDRFHPLFLYESLLSFIGVVVLVYLLKRFGPALVESVGETGQRTRSLVWSSRWRLRPGDMLLLYFIWYPAERFLLEFLKASKWEQGGVPMAQWISGGLILVALSVLIWRQRRPFSSDSVPIPVEGGRSRASRRRQRRRA